MGVGNRLLLALYASRARPHLMRAAVIALAVSYVIVIAEAFFDSEAFAGSIYLIYGLLILITDPVGRVVDNRAEGGSSGGRFVFWRAGIFCGVCTFAVDFVVQLGLYSTAFSSRFLAGSFFLFLLLFSQVSLTLSEVIVWFGHGRSSWGRR